MNAKQKISLHKNNDIINHVMSKGENKMTFNEMTKQIYDMSYKHHINHETKNLSQFRKELKSYFDTINNNEVKVSELNRELIKYHLCSEINVKLNFIYNKLDKFINDAADIKKLFYLEPKYYNELIRLINIDKNKNSNNRNYQNYKANKFIDLNSSNDNSEADINRTSIDNEERKKSKK